MNEVHTYKRSTMEVNITYRRFSINFDDVSTLPDFRERDTIVDVKNHYTGPIIPGGLAKLHEGKVRIRNSKSSKNKYLSAINCMYVPPLKSLWREKKNRSWWVACQKGMHKVVLRAIKVYSAKKTQAKKARKDKLRDMAYVFVCKTTFVFCFEQP